MERILGKIYTHFSLDLDAAASVWAVKQFISGMRDAQVVFVPANWDGAEMIDGDIAVDISAGGKGMKGEIMQDGITHSCFASLVNLHASPDEQQALAALVKFIDTQDAYGSAVKHFVPGISQEAFDVLSRTGINTVLRALQMVHPRNDQAVFNVMSDIFSGILKGGLEFVNAAKEADKAQLFDKVAIVSNAKARGVNGILFERGIEVIIYLDGNNLGLTRKDTCSLRMDHPAIQEIVKKAGEEIGDGEGKWFAHPKGFLFCWGSFKSPANNPSAVNPVDFASVVSALLGS